MATAALPALPDLSDGSVPLPTLTKDELWILGDDPVLRDATYDGEWAALGSVTKAALTETVLRGLVARELATPSQGKLVLHDGVRLLLGVRADPAFLVVGDEVDGDLRRPMRAYGIDVEERTTAAVLLEFAADGLHRHLLTQPQDAALRLAAWALEPRDDVEVVARTLEVLEPSGRTDEPSYRRAIVLAASGAARMAPLDGEGRPGDPELVDVSTLAEWLRSAWQERPTDLTSEAKA